VQWKRAIVATFAWAFAATVWAADADIVNEAEAMVRAGRYAEAFRLLEPLEDKLAGDLRYDYLLARSALETNNPSRASFIYERILAVEPNFPGVRLEMGRAYLALGDYARAKLEFETLLRFPNLPPDLRQQALVYAKAVEDRISGKRTVGFGYIEYGLGYDSNPTSATSIDPIIWTIGSSTRILDLVPSQLERSDQYQALAFGGELQYALADGISLFAGGDARLRAHEDIDTADYGSLDARAGFSFAQGPSNTRLGLTGGRYWLDGEKVRDNAGVMAEYRRVIAQTNQISVTTQFSAFRYIPEAFKVNDFDLLQATAGWLRVVNDGRGAVGISLLGGLENAKRGREDGDKPLYGARLTIQNAFTDRVGAFFLAGVQRGEYKEINPTFDRRRVDRLYDVVAGVTWTFAPGWSLRPQLLHLKNESNIELFEYERTDVSLNLRVDF
jgi:tetratricopeptide (TPR) repeat protein